MIVGLESSAIIGPHEIIVNAISDLTFEQIVIANEVKQSQEIATSLRSSQ